MGFFRKIGKALHVIDDPVSSALRNQGGALGTIGSIMNPGGAVNDKIANGAPINARTMFDPNGWIIPTPPPPEAPPTPLGALSAQAPLPPALQQRPVRYSQPTTNGPLTNLAFRMSGVPTNLPPAPDLPQAPMMPTQPDVGIPSVPSNMQALLNQPASNGKMRLLQMALSDAMQNGEQSTSGLPMLDPLDIARMRTRTGFY